MLCDKTSVMQLRRGKAQWEELDYLFLKIKYKYPLIS